MPGAPEDNFGPVAAKPIFAMLAKETPASGARLLHPALAHDSPGHCEGTLTDPGLSYGCLHRIFFMHAGWHAT